MILLFFMAAMAAVIEYCPEKVPIAVGDNTDVV